MRLARLVAVVAVLGTAGGTLAQDHVRGEGRRSAAGIVLRDTLAGGVLGSGVAGGIILYEMGINDNEDYDWGRTLAWGAGIGLATGLVLGIVDAVDEPAAHGMERRVPVRDGLSTTLGRRDQSGVQRFPLLVKRF